MAEDLAKLMLRLAREDQVAARALLPLDGVADSIVGSTVSRLSRRR
jgi:hypothetical protein